MHAYMTENFITFHTMAEGDGIAHGFRVEASSFLISQVHRNKTRLPESHVELKVVEKRNMETDMLDYS